MKTFTRIAILITLLVTTIPSYGQEKKLTVDAGADLVSSYVWRGIYQTGVSIQPTLSLSAYGVTLSAWGSTDFSTAAKELDFYISYQIKGFSIGVADYWWSGEGKSYFNDRKSHYLEANLSYTFSDKFPLSLGANTIFYGYGDKSDEGKGKQRYSTYFTASYPFAVKSVECEVGVGISPWDGMYSKGFNVATVTARATKKLQLSKKYELPVFAELIFAPARDNAYLVFGFKF